MNPAAKKAEDPKGNAVKNEKEMTATSGAPMTLAQVRKELKGVKGKRFWRSLDELADTPEFRAAVEQEFPTAAQEWVDPVSRREFWQILYGLRAEGACIVISTAYLDEADRCDRLALMHDGAVPYCEAPRALRARRPGGMVEISTPDARAARGALAAVPGVRGVLMVGDGVHVHVDDARQRIPELESALAQRRIEHAAAREVVASMEDLFVALLGQGASGAQQRAAS